MWHVILLTDQLRMMLLNTVETVYLFVGLFIELLQCLAVLEWVQNNKVLKSSNTSSKGTRLEFLLLKCDSQEINYIS